MIRSAAGPKSSRLENSPLLPNWTAYMAHVASPPLVSRVSDPRLLNRLLDVSGILEIGIDTDAATGFVSLVRLRDAKYAKV